MDAVENAYQRQNLDMQESIETDNYGRTSPHRTGGSAAPYYSQRTKKKYKFTDEERLSFVLFGILYASRCNNFHGNVAARMNSINANKDTFKMYTDMFLTEYIILAIHLNSQGALPDMVLNKVKENANLMV